MTRRYLLVLIWFIPAFLYAQKRTLTANQIIDSSIVFCGGEANISKISSIETTYKINEPNDSTGVVDIKIKAGEKFVQCILSRVYVPQTTFFNGKKICRVNGDSVTNITNIDKIEEVKLKTYSLVQYGYKKLKYQFSRLPDHKFTNFDCFVINAKAKNGYTTKNFFDKKNYRLIMVIYPNGNRSIMMDYIFKNGVLFNSRIGNSSANSDSVQTLDLISVNLNKNISDTWFNSPYTNKVFVPEYIKTGKFVSTNGEQTTFIRDKISMNYIDNNGKVDLRRFLAWFSPDTFALIDEKAYKSNNQSSSAQIIVRVVSWDDQGYVCQWITDQDTDTQDYKVIK